MQITNPTGVQIDHPLVPVLLLSRGYIFSGYLLERCLNRLKFIFNFSLLYLEYTLHLFVVDCYYHF